MRFKLHGVILNNFYFYLFIVDNYEREIRRSFRQICAWIAEGISVFSCLVIEVWRRILLLIILICFPCIFYNNIHLFLLLKTPFLNVRLVILFVRPVYIFQ